MASDALDMIRAQIGAQVAEIQRLAMRLSPLDLHSRMDAIREVAAAHGLTAMESLARSTAQRALLPGHRVTMPSCLEHMGEALDSDRPADCTAILAALAVRLH